MTEEKHPQQDRPAATVDRRRFLTYLGAGSATVLGAGLGLLPAGCARRPPTEPTLASGSWLPAGGPPSWAPPHYPVPLPADPWPPAEDRLRLAKHDVVDDLVLPEGFGYDIVAGWGDVFGPADDPSKQIRFGYNNDYTGLLEIADGSGDYWLLVNHEYVSPRPWLDDYRRVYGEDPPEFRVVASPTNKKGELLIDGWSAGRHRVDLDGDVPDEVRQTIAATARRMLSEMGISVLRVRRTAAGGLEVIKDSPDHKRITSISHHNIAPKVAASFAFTGPAAAFTGARPVGTMCNCSGGLSTWGTFFTCEENFQDQAHDEVTPTGALLKSSRGFGASADDLGGLYSFDDPTPSSLWANGLAIDEPLDGRQYGWIAEIDPETGRMVKHTTMGRFRHENVALRCEAGRPLAAYLGDDRRGGHVWKFVSDGVVVDPRAKDNSQLLERGTLYAARFHPDDTGEWIPIVPSTPLQLPVVENLASGHLHLPARPEGGTVVIRDEPDREDDEITVEEWQAQIEAFTGKPFAECVLGDLVRPEAGIDETDTEEAAQGILLLDAFAMANAAGATPTARPEDIEVHPGDRTVYVAFTDATDSGDGSPDRRIFEDSAEESSRQYGAVYRLIEGGRDSPDSDPAATTFTWGRFVASGEAADQGGGFACADNLAFDDHHNMWLVTDITTNAQNFPARGDDERGMPGKAGFPGVFGNNSVFVFATEGSDAGIPRLFALAPMDAELCGPSFTSDGKALVLSVQHPGEKGGTRTSSAPTHTADFVIHDRQGEPFPQTRTIPLGSNFPSAELDRPPRPCVVCITRKDNQA